MNDRRHPPVEATLGSETLPALMSFKDHVNALQAQWAPPPGFNHIQRSTSPMGKRETQTVQAPLEAPTEEKLMHRRSEPIYFNGDASPEPRP